MRCSLSLDLLFIAQLLHVLGALKLGHVQVVVESLGLRKLAVGTPSIISPLLMTKILSAFLMVLSLCAMIELVRPLINPLRAS
jgi:hypothetical protein